MSVLLDALKKAALEKRKRDALIAQHTDENPLEDYGEVSASATHPNLDDADTFHDDSFQPEGSTSDETQNFSQPQAGEAVIVGEVSEKEHDCVPDQKTNDNNNRHIIETNIDFDQAMLAEKEKLFGDEELSLDVDFVGHNETIHQEDEDAPESPGDEPTQSLEQLAPEQPIIEQNDTENNDDQRNQYQDNFLNSELDSTPENTDKEDIALESPDQVSPTLEVDEKESESQKQQVITESQQDVVDFNSSTAADTSQTQNQPEASATRQDQQHIEQSPSASNATSTTVAPTSKPKSKPASLDFAEELLREVEADAGSGDHKITFLSLVERNQKAFASHRKKFIVLMSLLTVVATILLGAYFYMVTHESNSLGNYAAVSPDLSSRPSLPISESGFIEFPEADADVVSGEQDLIPQNEMSNDEVETLENTSQTTEESDNEAATPSTIANQAVAATSTTVSSTSSGVSVTAPEPAPAPSTRPQPQRIAVRTVPTDVDPFTNAIASGYAAYQAGNLSEAQVLYQQAIKLKPDHRDALLGSAGVAVALGNYQNALSYYQQVLINSPNDSFAQAGVLSIASAGDYSPGLISQVNYLLKSYPDAPHLYFLQGVLYTNDGRWSEAQASFFDAWRLQPSRGDYAYNLAIALDHLGESKEALKYYQQARQQVNTSIAPIDLSAIDLRINQIEAEYE